MRDDLINTPEQLRKQEERANKNRKELKNEDVLDKRLLEQFDKFSKNPMKTLRENFGRGVDLHFQNSLYRYFKLIVIIKSLEK